MGKAVAVGIGAASTAVGALTTMSVKGYSDYEQLAGGVDTLFKSSSKTIQKYAANAYKTAGMSANQYMNTATSFSASLIQSLKGDTKKAAEQTNKAITDMSDNANKMGTDIESIQNAYQGFAKQNYTMLDNLKLGYGGTKEEMERLLEDAEKISGIKYDVSSYSDIVDAIHVVQTEMDITGTTAKEASTTIQGSLGMVKSSWQNLVTSLSDPDADIGAKIDDFVSSVTTAAGNLIPAVEQALSGAGALISELLPQIINEIPNLINDVIPDLLSKVDTLISTTLESIDKNKEKIIKGLVDLLIKLVDLVAENAPKFVGVVMSLITTVFNTLADKSDEIVPKIFNAILNMVDEFLKELPNTFDAILNLIVSLVNSIVDYLPTLVDKLPEILDGILMFILKSIPTIIKSIGTIVSNISDDLPDLLTSIFKALPEMITSLVEAIPELLESIIALGIQGLILPFELLFALGKAIVQAIFGEEAADEMEKSVGEFFDNLWVNIGNFLSDVVTRNANNFSEVWNKITGFFSGIGEWFQGLWENITSVFSGIGEWFSGIWNQIADGWHTAYDPWIEIFKRAADWVNTNVVQPVTEFFKGLWENVSGFFSNLWDDISGVWSTVSDWFNTNVIEPVSGFFGGIWEKVSDGASQAWEGVKNAFSPVINWFKNTFHEAWTKVKDVFSKGGEIFTGIKEGLFNGFKVVVNGLIDGINYIISQTFWGLNNALKNIHNVEILGVKPFEWINTIDVPEIPKLAKGGVVEGGTPFIAGEAGAEAVIPLENNNQWIYKFAHAFADGLNSFYGGDNFVQSQNRGAGNKIININLYLDNVNVKNDDDIEDVANKVSERIAEKLVMEGMAVG